MTTELTIVMYHYVRELRGSKYPEIKGLELTRFRGQLDWLAATHRIVSLRDILARSIPENAVLLTFDDGYIDHYQHVFPLLVERGLPALFFPVAQSSMGAKVLDVNKIHFVLATIADKSKLVAAVDAFVMDRRDEYGLCSIEEYHGRMRNARFDTSEVLYIKRMLQRDLPLPARENLIGELFTRYVSKDEADFAANLYTSPEQWREMCEAGLSIGAHGSTHRWLSTLSRQEQGEELQTSLCFLRRVGMKADEMTVCYPYGDYNADTIELAAGYGFRLGFTTRVAKARYGEDPDLELPRYDTNDFPCEAQA